MKTTKQWWTIFGACALACGVPDDLETGEAQVLGEDDGDGELCEITGDEDACRPEELAAEPPRHNGRCGVHPSEFEVAVMEADFATRLAAAPSQPSASERATIPVWFHVIRGSNGAGACGRVAAYDLPGASREPKASTPAAPRLAPAPIRSTARRVRSGMIAIMPR